MKIKTLYLIVIGLITAICIIIGSTIHMGSFNFFNLNFVDTKTNEIESIDKQENITLNNIDIDADYLSVEILAGDSYKNEYKGDEIYKPTIDYDNDSLYIYQKDIKTPINKNDVPKLQIILPKDHNIDTTKISIDLGEITVTDFKTKGLTIDSDLGTISINSGNINFGEINADMGNINIDGTKIENVLKLNKDCGNVKLKNIPNISDATINASCSLGNVTVNHEDINYKGNRYEISKNEPEISIEVDLGNIDIL